MTAERAGTIVKAATGHTRRDWGSHPRDGSLTALPRGRSAAPRRAAPSCRDESDGRRSPRVDAGIRTSRFLRPDCRVSDAEAALLFIAAGARSRTRYLPIRHGGDLLHPTQSLHEGAALASAADRPRERRERFRLEGEIPMSLRCRGRLRLDNRCPLVQPSWGRTPRAASVSPLTRLPVRRGSTASELPSRIAGCSKEVMRFTSVKREFITESAPGPCGWCEPKRARPAHRVRRPG